MIIIKIKIKRVHLINEVQRKAAEVPPSSLETNQVLKSSSQFKYMCFDFRIRIGN